MMLLEKWRENERRVQEVGHTAIAQARAAGVPAYYRDPSLGEGIVKEMPDGRRLLIEDDTGEDRLIAELGPCA